MAINNAFLQPTFRGQKRATMPQESEIDAKDDPTDKHDSSGGRPKMTSTTRYLVLPSTVEPTETDSQDDSDSSNYVFKDIVEMLMSDDIEQKASMFVDSSALQDVEESLYEVLGTKYPPSPNQHTICYPGKFSCNYNCNNCNTMCDKVLLSTSTMPRLGGSFDGVTHSSVSILLSSNSHHSIGEPMTVEFRSGVEEVKKSFPCQNLSIIDFENNELPPMSMDDTPENEVEKNERDFLFNGVGGKKDIRRKDGDHMEEGRGGKQLTICDTEEDDLSETFDMLFLCLDEHEKHVMRTSNEVSQNGANKLSVEKGEISIFNAKNSQTKKTQNKEVANLRKLLILCARAIAINDIVTENELLKKIRQHSSPFGCASQRIAHYFANGLEARMIGSGSQIYAALSSKKPSVNLSDTLKAYETIMLACPFKRINFDFASKNILNLVENTRTLHIIDFGILYGFQWPAFIEDLSTRFSKPPKLRITGIEFPQSGFRPKKLVEDTGHRLAKYCEQFNVPFEYNAIAKKWETIKIEDIKIRRNDVIVVNSQY
ncbi:scarecrow-like protein 14 [Malania oleifera]|uniref:scarecrow-like protein 14 n=1 Tax=Malania oleifera TaxID=397392 RepID=UPI0025AE8825|nr:scarecrow-like protein 14 [Malania oleifera]